MKCMEETNIADLAAIKEILSDTSGSYPEEKCLRKCLYFHFGVVHENGAVDVSLRHF
jgi:PBP/GOBP family